MSDSKVDALFYGPLWMVVRIRTYLGWVIWYVLQGCGTSHHNDFNAHSQPEGPPGSCSYAATSGPDNFMMLS